VVGHLSAKDSTKGILGRAPLLGNPKDEVFERYAKCPVNGPPFTGALLENQEGVHLSGL